MVTDGDDPVQERVNETGVEDVCDGLVMTIDPDSLSLSADGVYWSGATGWLPGWLKDRLCVGPCIPATIQ